LNPFADTLPLPEPFPLASYAFELVLTDAAHKVVDVLDPVLITGSASDLAGINLSPNVPSSTVPEAGSALPLLAVSLASLLIVHRVVLVGATRKESLPPTRMTSGCALCA
jgi:hypothetical protein